MAASEAFLNSIIGGGDATAVEADTSSGAGTSSDTDSQSSVAESVAEVTPKGGGEESPTSETAATAKAPDQVANLNAAIRETRSENKALKQQLQELTAKIEALSKPPETKQAAQEHQEPDFLADPKGYVDAQKAKLKQLEDKLEADKKQQAEQQTAQQQAQETWSKVLESEAQFVATTPDYHQALAHVRQVRTQQLQMLHPDATPQQIAAHIQGEEFQGAAALIAQGKNPSEFYYNYAKTFGYKPAAPAQQQQSKPDKDAVRTMGSGGGAEHVGTDEPVGALGILAAAQSEHKAQFKRKK